MNKRTGLLASSYPKRAGVLVVFSLVLISGCGEEKRMESEGIKAVLEKELKPIADTEPIPELPESPPIDNSEYFDDPEFKEFFGEPVSPTPFDYSINCSGLSLAELRCLRNEIFARHGYLFKDAVLRGFFNQKKWYQPIFWDDSFTVELSEKEQWFVEKLLRLEKKHLARNLIHRGEDVVANTENIVNTIQFESIPDTLKTMLARNGFAVVDAKHQQLFHIYDKNVYDCIPSYITTDLYLQLLHMHYSNMMKKIETTKLTQRYEKMISAIHDYASETFAQYPKHELLSDAAAFATTYFAIAQTLLMNEPVNVVGPYHSAYKRELQKISMHSGMGSEFLSFRLFDYSQLKPRGHYTHTEELTHYFRAVKWLLTAPFTVSTDRGLASAIICALALQEAAFNEYMEIAGVVSFLAGEPDNLSVMDLLEVLKSDFQNYDLPVLVSSDNLDAIRAKIYLRAPERIHTCAVSPIADEEMKEKRLHFMSGRYTFDAEIVSRLIHCRKPKPKRPFPKGLDVFAVLNNEMAERLLLNEYKEQHSWPPYSDTLQMLQQEYTTFKYWNKNAYNRRMALLSVLNHTDERSPYYMHLDAWKTRTLTTALAGWTQLKHEVVLYAKQPLAAQCGEGGIPPPSLVGFVEPNTVFWEQAIDLVRATSEALDIANMQTPELLHIHKKLSAIASFLLKVSKKQLAHEKVTDEEYHRIAYLGGEIENLTLTIMDTDHFQQNDPERQIGIVTDVFTNNELCLQEAIGYANEIYIVVEIGGLLHLTRGAVLSYYEFKHPSANRLTDIEWQGMLERGENPEPPEWTQRVFVPMETLRTKPEYSYLIPGGC